MQKIKEIVMEKGLGAKMVAAVVHTVLGLLRFVERKQCEDKKDKR